jgi:hypothetical protein
MRRKRPGLPYTDEELAIFDRDYGTKGIKRIARDMALSRPDGMRRTEWALYSLARRRGRTQPTVRWNEQERTCLRIHLERAAAAMSLSLSEVCRGARLLEKCDGAQKEAD